MASATDSEQYPADEVLKAEEAIGYAYDAALKMIGEGYSLTREEAEQELIDANASRNSNGTPPHLFQDFHELGDFIEPFSRENVTSLTDELSKHDSSSYHIPLHRLKENRTLLIQNYTYSILDIGRDERFGLHSLFHDNSPAI